MKYTMKRKEAFKSDIGRCKTVEMSIDDLVPADYNPRSMDGKNRAGLSYSVDTFGLVQPIVWNRKTRNVVGGHQRLADIIIKGATVTDVVVVDLSLSKEKALNVALNAKGLQGEFKIDEVDAMLKDLDDVSMIKNLNLDDLVIDDSWEDDLEEDKAPPEEKPSRIIITIPNDVTYCKDELYSEVLRLIEMNFSETGINATQK